MVMEIIISVVLLVGGISALVFIHICIVSRAFAGDDHQKVVIFDDGNGFRRRGVGGGRGGIEKVLDEEAMMESGIPCFSYKQGRDGSASAVVEYCVVCLEKLGFAGDDHQKVVIFDDGNGFRRRGVGGGRGGIEKVLDEEAMMESGIPCFSYKQGRDGSASAVVEYCVVCLEKLAVGESCRLLPNCSHCFHARCIDSWLLQTPVCPICRAGVDVVASPVSGSDSGELVSGLVEDG